MEPSPLPDRSDREFVTLLDAYRGALRRFAQRLEPGSEDAEDLLQESVVDAYRAFGNFRAGSNFYSWMTRIITNNHLDRVRKRRIKTISLEGTTLEGEAETLEVPDDSANPERSLLTRLFDPRLEEALAALLPAQRTTVMLCDLEGASYEEAAQAQGCPIGTIRSRLHRAHAALQRFLAGAGFVSEARLEDLGRTSRRNLLRMGTAMAAGVVLAPLAAGEPADAEPAEIRVRICSGETAGADEGEASGRIARGLRRDGRFRIAGGSTGLSLEALEETEVVVLVGEGSHPRLTAAVEEGIARRVQAGRLGLVVTGNAAECRPLARVLGSISFTAGEGADAAKALTVQVSAPRHPVASGVPTFTLPGGGAPGGFEGPRPDMVVFRSPGDPGGADTWQGLAWSAGQGRVFCFLPGSVPAEAYGQEAVSQVLRNAVAWCAAPNR